MKALLKGVLLSCVLVMLTGCSNLAGAWHVVSIEPESAKEAFPMAGLCLKADHSFTACMECGGKMSGTYEYDAKSELLTFKSEKGKTRTYKACLCSETGQLIVRPAEEGKEWKAVLKRSECCKDKCDPKKCDPNKCKSQPPAKSSKCKT